MRFDFDQEIDRSNSNALAVEDYQNYLFGSQDVELGEYRAEDLIYLWVADMQFATPQCVIQALKDRLEHPIFGYTMNFDDRLFDAFSNWISHHYDWHVDRQDFFTSLGVIPTLYNLVEYTVRHEGKVLTLTPAYGFFKHAASHFDREIVGSPLVKGERFQIDFVDFEKKASDPLVDLFFLCHPHNPTGQEWSEAELRKLGHICLKNDVLIVSDEIHCDLLRCPSKHTPFAKLFPDSDKIITCMSPSKTFNLAGMMTGMVIIEDEGIKKKWCEKAFPFISPLGLAAATSAYEDGEDWLAQLKLYLDENFQYLHSFLKKRLPNASFNIPDATYLAWIDLSRYFSEDVNLTQFFLKKAGVVIEGGEMFVENGTGFMRLNIACPKHILANALNRIAVAIDEQSIAQTQFR